jgi:hypothetical protein
MRENSLCSTLFHFEVPGGKCMTVTDSPFSSAKAARSILNKTESAEFAPPASAVISSRVAVG